MKYLISKFSQKRSTIPYLLLFAFYFVNIQHKVYTFSYFIHFYYIDYLPIIFGFMV